MNTNEIGQWKSKFDSMVKEDPDNKTTEEMVEYLSKKYPENESFCAYLKSMVLESHYHVAVKRRYYDLILFEQMQSNRGAT